MDGWLAGIDGCRAGWIACLKNRADGTLRFRFGATLQRIVDGPEQPDIVAIDMPFGLADCAEPGGRDCERAARRLLRGRASSVFATPCRAAVEAETYGAALALNRASHAAALGFSKQAWNIVPRIKELDARLRERPELQPRIHEAHPELAFARMNGGIAVREPKRTAEGRARRLALLRRHGFKGLNGTWAEFPPGVLAADDLLDAVAVCRTAELIGNGAATTLPDQPVRDAHGLRMAITF